MAYQTHLDNLSLGLNRLVEIVETSSSSEPSARFGFNGSEFDRLRDKLGHDLGTADSNPVGRVMEMLSRAPEGPSRRFLQEKFSALRDPSDAYKGFFSIHRSVGLSPTDHTMESLTALSERGEIGGATDAVNDTFGAMTVEQRRHFHSLLLNSLKGLHFDRPGTAYFHGVIYSGHSIRVSNEIHVMGAVVADGEPGDIVFEDGSVVTYVEELGQNAGISSGRIGMRSWVLR